MHTTPDRANGDSAFAGAATYDLTEKMVPFLDRHLVFPLLEFLGNKNLYPQEDMLKAKYDLLSATNMVDYCTELYKELRHVEEVPEEFERKRNQVLTEMAQLEQDAQKIIAVIENPEVIAALKQDKQHNRQFLEKEYGFTSEMAQDLFKYGRFQYSCGNYGGAGEILYHYRVLSTDAELDFAALWGKLACEILTGNWEVALEEVQNLKEHIESKNYDNPAVQLMQRSWLIHWSLFIFFNSPKGRDGIIDMLFQPQYLNAIQTSCPWILRYLATAVVTNKRRKNYLKDLVKIVQQESYQYRDPITEFVQALYVDFNFEAAQRKLAECEGVLAQDFFLVATYEDFVENARCFITEAYFRIYQKIDIAELSRNLNMELEDGEKWIANLIRDTRMDAKIDFEQGVVMMNVQQPTVYQQVIDKTKGLSMRSQAIIANVDRLGIKKWSTSGRAVPPAAASAGDAGRSGAPAAGEVARAVS